MTAENFCYWLQGIFEIQMAGLDANEKRVPKLTEAQIEMIQQHLGYVFAKKQPTPQQLSDFGAILGKADLSTTGASIC